MARTRRSGGGLVGVVVGAVVGVGIVALAGDVDPPAGPVDGTMKTLVDVEPRVALRNDPGGSPLVISSRGSYYLAETIFAKPGEHGIEILSSDVTLDLNGFAVIGNVEVGSLDGIRIDGNAENVAVLNGTVRDCPESGIYANATEVCRFENVRILNCNDFGIIGGDRAAIIGCQAHNCGVGFQTTDGGMISGCSAVEGGTGFFSNGGLVHGCSASNNTTNFSIALATGHDNS